MFGILSTEKRNEKSMNLDELNALDICRLMNEEDHRVIQTIADELPGIARAIEMVKTTLQQGGRLIYCGAGTSGRIGLLDAVECPPTFRFDSTRVIGLLAGAQSELFQKEEAEDSIELGKEDLIRVGFSSEDVLVGLSASGRTPYVQGALEYATQIGSSSIVVCCNKQSVLKKFADHAIELDCGPEIVTGSTRLKAGTAQKMVVNMISTGAMILLGRVYENLMIDVEPSNEKLVNRWLSLVMDATNCSFERAQELFASTEGRAKVAVIMEKLNVSKSDAEVLISSEYDGLKSILVKYGKTSI